MEQNNEKIEEKIENFHLEEITEKKPTKVYSKPGKLKVALFWICGIESSLKQNFEVTSEKQLEQVVDTSIDQDPFWANVCNVNAIVAISLSGFCIAFFNRYE